MVPTGRPGGQAQSSVALSLQLAGAWFGALHGWIEAHLGDHRTLAAMAGQAGMSEIRLVRAVAGTPQDYRARFS